MPSSKWRFHSFSLIGLGLLCAASLRVAAVADEKSAVEERLLQDVKTLADDGFEGRGVGTDGLNKAAEYVSHAFTAAGLETTAAGGDPYQEFEITTGAELTS